MIVPTTQHYPDLPPSYSALSCEDCEFFCWTEENFGKCNVSLDKALGWGVCDNFTPLIPRKNEYVIAFNNFANEVSFLNSNSFTSIVDAEAEKAYSLIQKLYPGEHSTRQLDICISCGSPLKIKTLGRRKFCAHCGCYLPEIIYSKGMRI